MPRPAHDTARTTLVDLLRHGEPLGGKRFRGQTDDPLSELGWRQMREALGNEVPWRHIVTSPLRRCGAFAEAMAQEHKLSLSVETRFKEIGFGEWEGYTPEEIQQRDGERYRRYRDDPAAFMPAGAEPMSQFIARVAQAWDDLLAAQRGRHVLVICHAGVIRAVLGEVLGMTPERLFRIRVDYASVSRIQITDNQPPSLVFHGAGLP
jgi:broad specificity phosphatase PhoE